MAHAVVLRSRLWTTRRTTRPRRQRCPRPLRASSWTEFDEMEREMDRAFDSFSRLQRYHEEQFNELTAEIQQEFDRASDARGMRMEKMEGRKGSSYYYYESVTIGGDPWTLPNVASSSLVPYGGSGWWTVLLLLFGAIYSILTFRFNQAFGQSSFREDQRLKLSVLWPGLLVSPEFRKKFSKMVSSPTDKEN